MSMSRLPDGRVAYEGSLQQQRKRLTIGATIIALRSLFWLRSTAAAVWFNLSARLLDLASRPTQKLMMVPELLEG